MPTVGVINELDGKAGSPTVPVNGDRGAIKRSDMEAGTIAYLARGRSEAGDIEVWIPALGKVGGRECISEWGV